MKILLLQFDSVRLSEIKNVLKNTSFKDSEFHEYPSFEEAKPIITNGGIELIIWLGNPDECLANQACNKIIEKIPLLFITDNARAYKIIYEFSERINYLPINEISNFVLAKTLFNTLEKQQTKNKLNEVVIIKKELELKEAKYRALFENSAIGLYEIDLNGNFILANQVFLKILGLSNILELQNFNAFEPGISLNGSRAKLKKLLFENENVDNFEDQWQKLDSTKIIVKENIRANKDENGIVRFYQGVVEDITDRKNVESELVKSKKDAEKSDRLKSEFLTQISHEIRTPVNTLLSFAQLIKEDLAASLSEDLIDSFTHMDKAGKRIIRTIDLIIKMSELHTENYEPEFKQNNLFELLDELVTIYKPMAQEKNLDLQLIKAIDSANIVFDKLTMYDVLSNIIDNAIKFTMNGNIKIYVKNSLLNKITVTIIDTGIGISEKYIGNIFKPFSQETSGYTRKFDGNGLGLALVKEYCNLNNAEIFVSSEKAVGSNFTIIFK